MNCEFCNEQVHDNGGFADVEITSFVAFHKNCLEKAISALAKITHEPKISLETLSDSSWMVIMDPNETLKSAPRQHYNSYTQAVAVARDLTKKTRKTFWVIKHVASTTIS